MHLLLSVIAAFSSVFMTGVSGPVIAPLDQASETVLVGHVHAASRVDVFANARWIGGAIARGPVVRIRPIVRLMPGEVIVAEERTGSVTTYGLNPTVVQNDYVTYHYDNLRTGWDQSETSLTQANVGSNNFGQLFATQVDGNVEAQPLFLSQLAIPNKGTHDVVYAATENDTMYALDASSGTVLWKRHYANAANGFTPFGQPDVGCKFITPGRDVAGSPVDIQASLMVPGGGMVNFVPQWQLQRPGLLLSGGVVYIAFGSFCDLQQRQSHGWILGYSETSLKQVAAFTASLATGRGMSSFWGGGYGIAADQSGDIFAATGNGDFNGNTGGSDWGDTILKLSPSLSVL